MASNPTTPLTPSAPTVSTAHDLASLTAALTTLRTHEAHLTRTLDAHLSSHTAAHRSLQRIDLTRARLSKLSSSARALASGPLSNAASTASTISTSVERLDTEQARVRATLAVVEQVATLKQCVLGVMGSMGAPQDWETAASYLERARQIPAEVIESGFAEQVVPTAEVPDPPRVTLDHASESLCTLFLAHFETAARDGDGATITRFFKMFPQIGRAEAGLKAYARYVCGGVAQRARQKMSSGMGSKDGQFYVGALTGMFEHIAQVVDGHSGLVERHYGRGTMRTVMARLHAEIADVQGGIVLDTWSEERGIERKLTDVKSYAFTFLVQSFLAPQRTAAPARTASPAPGGAGKIPTEGQDEGIEMKEVDSVLSDVAGMMGPWALYARFISSRALVRPFACHPSCTSDADRHVQEASLPEDADEDDLELQMPDFLAESNLPKRISKLLMEPFSHFATFFLRRSVEKSFQLEEFPQGLTLNPNKHIAADPPYVTSTVDDVMYIVSQLVRRSLATSSGPLMTSVTATIGRVLGSDFIGMIQRKMRDECYPKAAVQGAMPPEDKIISFLVLINNLDIATQYIRRIVHQQLDVPPPHAANGHHASQRSLEELFPMGREGAAVRQSLRTLETTFATKASELQTDGIAVAFAQIVKPRLRPLLSEVFKEIDVAAMEDAAAKKANGHADDEEDVGSSTSIKVRFQQGWDSIVRPVRNILTEKSSEKLMSTATLYVSNLLEKRIWSYQGRVSELGSLELEKNVSDLANAAVKGANFKLRENFNRCFQIVTIMTMEDEEWDEIKGRPEEADQDWVLNEDDRLRARSMLRIA